MKAYSLLTPPIGSRILWAMCISLLLLSGPIVAKPMLPAIVPDGENIKDYPDLPFNIGDAVQERSSYRSITFSSDGRLLAAVANVDGSIKLWDVNMRRLLHSFSNLSDLPADERAVNTKIAFNADNKKIAITSNSDSDNTLKIWSIQNKKLLHNIHSPSEFTSLAFSPDGSILATASKQGIKLWNAQSLNLLKAITHKDRPHRLAFNTDSSLLFWTNDKNHTVTLWSIKKQNLLYTLKNNAYAITPDPNRIMLLDDNDSQNKHDSLLWNIKERREITRFKNTHQCMSSSDIPIIVNPDITLFTVLDCFNEMDVWNIKTQTQVDIQVESLYTDHDEEARGLAFNPQNNILAASNDLQIELWDMKHLKKIDSLGGHRGNTHQAMISPNGNTLVSRMDNGSVQLWDIHNHQPLHNFNTPEGIQTWAYNFDGSILATSSTTGWLMLWNLDTFKLLTSFPINSISSYNDILFSPDGNLLAIIDPYDDRLIIWNIHTHERVHKTYTGVRSAAFTPDGQSLFISSWKEEVRSRVINIKTGKKTHDFSQYLPDHSVFSPDGRTLMIGNSDKVRLLDINSGQLLNEFNTGAHIGCFDEYSLGLAFNADGQILISTKGSSQLRNGRNGTLLSNLKAPWSYSLSSTSNSNQFVVTGGALGSIEVWDTNRDEPVLSIIQGRQGNWLMWDDQGKFWRGDDGSLLLQKDFSPLPLPLLPI